MIGALYRHQTIKYIEHVKIAILSWVNNSSAKHMYSAN